MSQTKYFLDHIDALLRLSHDVKERAVSEKLREMADEFRIMVSVADITNLAAVLSRNTAPSARDLTATPPLASRTHIVAREDSAQQPSRSYHARYVASNRGLACARVGAP